MADYDDVEEILGEIGRKRGRKQRSRSPAAGRGRTARRSKSILDWLAPAGSGKPKAQQDAAPSPASGGRGGAGGGGPRTRRAGGTAPPGGGGSSASAGATPTRGDGGTPRPGPTLVNVASQGLEATGGDGNMPARSPGPGRPSPGPEEARRAEEARRLFAWYDPLSLYAPEAEGYLLDVRYEGKLGKAVALIYEPGSGRVVKWIDRTGHRPYFLVDMAPEEIRKARKGVEEHESFVTFEVVSKFDPIRRERRRMTKIVVADPLAVRDLRGRFKEEGAWEADIKYHHNYIYDHGLIPTMKYRTSRRGWERLNWGPSDESVAKLREAFKGEPDDVVETAIGWLPIFEQPPPKPPMAAFDIEVDTPEEGRIPDPSEAVQPIISIALAGSDGVRRVYMLRRPGVEMGEMPDGVEVRFYDSELEMIDDFLRDLSRYPVVLTFNGDHFDFPYIYNRLKVLGVDPRRSPIIAHQDYYSIDWGVHIDLHRLFDIKALQTYAFGNKYREKSLDAIASVFLGEHKVELTDTVSNISYGELARYNMRDADLTLKLMQFGGGLVWHLTVLLARISKLGLEDVTRTQVSGWIRSLMYWEHRRRGWLIPRKEDIAKYGNMARSRAIIKDKKYKGAIVLTPPQGIFFDVIVLDFASLYPSIIKNWNLSYETVNNPFCKGEERVVPDVGHRVCMAFRGITSEIVGLLRDFRVKIYKKKAKQKDLPEEERLWYDTVQAAMKVYINASYGVFGNENFSLFSLAVAESVTAIGRTVLKDTARKAESLDLHIIYGDTDSLFFWSPRREALEELIAYVREKHNLDLEIDKVFRLVVFSGLKKNYIGVSEDGKITVKGMVGKKSNTPEFIKKEFQRAVELLASITDVNDVERVMEDLRKHVREIQRKLKNREYTLDELAFRVTLTKDLHEYQKNTPQHVKAALQLKKEGIMVSKGSIITFVKTRDSLGVKPVKLAKLAEVDVGKYQEYIKTSFEQMLQALGVRWEELSGSRRLEALLGGV